MKRFIAAAVLSAFAFGTVSTYAADAAQKDELTVEQRADMRARATRMKEQGQQTQAPVQEKVQKKIHKVKKHSAAKAKHAKKVVKRSATKAQPHA